MLAHAGISSAAMNSTITRHSITWTFDKQYEAGQFVNGDWWVVGPAKVISISPHTKDGRDGSNVNLNVGISGVHGYDARLPGYQSSLDVSRSLPRILEPNSSLVSSISHGECGQPGVPSCEKTLKGVPRPTLRTAAILTVLKTAPPEGTFRPPYYGRNKPLYSISQLRPEILPQLNPVAQTPTLSTVERNLERVWLDHKFDWTGDYLHPTENMRNYGADLTNKINEASLMLMLNESKIGNKERLMIRFVQIGIDMYGLVENGFYWPANGGVASGRKWPILFSGILLDDAGMLDIGSRTFPISNGFGEDCQTYYSSPGVPAYGVRHCRGNDDQAYRTCCTGSVWIGEVLSARFMKAEQLWNHNALFDYEDALMKGNYADLNRLNPFAVNMWNTYRYNLPNPPPPLGKVRFTASPRSGEPPLQVTFTNSSTGNFNTWLWDFGDGTTSTLKNTTHTYQTYGTYTITLTGTGTDSTETFILTDYISIRTEPIIIEAEDMTLSGYIVDLKYDGFRDMIMVDPALTVPATGTAVTTFTGGSGTYKISLYTGPENDGDMIVKLYVNGNTVINEVLAYTSGTMRTAERIFTASNVAINKGDQIKIEGTSHLLAFARVDKIEFTPLTAGIDNNFSSSQVRNPFSVLFANPVTERIFIAPQSGNELLGAVLSIYSSSGEKISVISADPQFGQISWNGMDSNGDEVPAGIYLYDLTGPGGSQYGKFTYLGVQAQ